MQSKLTLQSPLFTEWSEQYVRLHVDDIVADAPLTLSINGTLTPFQSTGNDGEIMVRLGFAKGETKELVFTPAAQSDTDLQAVALALAGLQRIGVPSRAL